MVKNNVKETNFMMENINLTNSKFDLQIPIKYLKIIFSKTQWIESPKKIQCENILCV